MLQVRHYQKERLWTGGAIYLTDSQGNQYSGWYVDSNEDWYYFDDSNKAMKTGWHHDGVDG